MEVDPGDTLWLRGALLQRCSSTEQGDVEKYCPDRNMRLSIRGVFISEPWTEAAGGCSTGERRQGAFTHSK